MMELVKELLVVAAQHDAKAQTGTPGSRIFKEETAKAQTVRDSLFRALAELDMLEAANERLETMTENLGVEDGFLEQYHLLFNI